jgi:ParB family chromosome partitioning protein
LENDAGHTIVCGFRRIEACRRLKWSTLNAKILDSDTKRLQCVQYAISDNAFQRPLNIIEKSRSIEMLSGFFTDIGKLTRELAVLGLSDHSSIIKKIKGICFLPDPLQNSILSNTISFNMALDLAGMSWDDAKGFVELFNTLKLSLNKQREIVTLVKEISIREDTSIIQVLEEPYLKKVLTDENLDKNQRTHKVRIYLKQRRFPSIAEVERSFEKYRKKLNLGKHIKLIPPNNFEGPTYTLNITFKTLKDLKDLETAFNTLIDNPFLKKIID